MSKAFSIQNLEKKYPEFCLGPLNLDLEPGTVLGYVGPNGSGKSTTMHILAGLVKKDHGTVSIFGRPNNMNQPEWKFDIGYVGDVHVFYENWSGAKNLKFLSAFYPDWSEDLVEKLVRRFNVPLKKKAKELSRGNRVKLALVSALAHSPRLLLLDEPTSGLDPMVRAEVLEVLFEILEDGERAIFYSTHILSDINRLADELAFLSEGKLILRTAKDDLTENWRKLSFRYAQNDLVLPHAVSHEIDGPNHQIITSNFELTIKSLRESGVENLQDSRMSIDEIAVQVMKEGQNVENYKK